MHPTLTRVLSLALCLCAFWAAAAPSRSLAQTQTGPPPPPSPTPAQKAPAPLPRKAVAGARVGQGWQRYEIGAPPVLSVDLPPKHVVETEMVTMGGSRSAPAYAYTGETDDGTYIAYFVENLPLDSARMPEGIKQSFYDGVWEGMAKGIKSGMEKNGLLIELVTGQSKMIKVGGLDAREQDFTLGPLKGRARVVLSGNRAFLVLLLELGDTISGTGLAFLDSLEVRAPR